MAPSTKTSKPATGATASKQTEASSTPTPNGNGNGNSTRAPVETPTVEIVKLTGGKPDQNHHNQAMDDLKKNIDKTQAEVVSTYFLLSCINYETQPKAGTTRDSWNQWVSLLNLCSKSCYLLSESNSILVRRWAPKAFFSTSSLPIKGLSLWEN